MEVRGRTVLVTGASRGIGEGIARRFAAAGANVIGAARSVDALDALADEIGGGAVAFDAADADLVDGFIDRVEAEHGPIDVLVNNAGVELSGLVEDLDEADIELLIRVNLITPQRLTRQVLPGMLERGRGHLVYTSSLAATGGGPTLAVYSSTKAGLTRFAESARIELARDGIGVTILHLGPIDTSMWSRVEADVSNRAAIDRGKKFGALDLGSVADVAEATLRAVRTNRREVRVPWKTALPAMFSGVGTRLNELVYRGIDFRAEHGKRA